MEAFIKLEHDIAEWLKVLPEQVVCCSSGTAALHLALESLHLPQGSEVLLSDFNMIACVRAITLSGLSPVFVDCDDRLLLDLDLADAALCVFEKVRAIMPVHIYGRRCDMNQVHALARKYGLAVIEDLAECHGVPIDHRTDASCYSFYKNKIVHGEEGGCVVFKNKDAADSARRLRCLGFTSEHDYTHVPRGHNYRLANTLASLITESLEDVDLNIQARKWIESLYNNVCPDRWKQPGRDAVWVYDIRIPQMTAERQNNLVRCLKQAGIQARHGFKPLSSQPEYLWYRIGKVSSRVKPLWKATRASNEVIYLPAAPGEITEEVVCKTFEIIHSCLGM